MSKPTFLVLAAVVVIVAASAVLMTRKDRPTSSTPQDTFTGLPSNTFDGSATIPATKVSFAYPTKGFYGLGAKLSKENGNAHLETTSPYVLEKGSEFVTLHIAVTENTKKDTLESLVTRLKSESVGRIEESYLNNGSLKTIGDRDFYVYKTTEDVTVWSAFTVTQDAIINATLSYKATDGAESQAAYANNDKLFIEILERVSVK